MSTSCQSCAHYDHHTNNGQVSNDKGLCRYNPPVSQPGPDARGLWPVVAGSDWCAHFATQTAAGQHSAA